MLKVRHVKKKMKRKPTAQRLRLRRNLLSGKYVTHKKAALAAGYSESTSRAVGTMEMKILREEFPEILARHGLTDDALVDGLKDLMCAKETKFGVYKGKFKEKRDVVAWGPRRDGLEMAFRLRGAFVSEKKPESIGPATITIEIVNIAGDEKPKVKAIDVTPVKAIEVKSADTREVTDSSSTPATGSL